MSLLSRILATRDAKPAATRSYEGATPSARRFGAGAATFGPWASEASAAREPLQRRARHFHENNPLAHSGVSAWVNAAVGAGITATSQHPDPDTRKILDREFRRWTRRADLESRSNFEGLQAATVKAERIDGEALFRWVGDRLQQIPAEQLDMAMTRDLGAGRIIVNGVELDADGRRVAYWIHPAKPSDQFPTYAPPVRVPAEDVIHVFRPTGPGAVRGVSALAPILLRLAELDATEDAYQVAAKVSAMLSVILSNQNDVSGEDPLPDGQGLEPGAILKLAGGWNVDTIAPQQAQQIGDFLSHMTRTIAAGLDVPEHLLTGDMRQANYSSLRAALVAFRQKIEAYQFNCLVPQMLDPVWRRVVGTAVLSGRIDSDLDDDLFAVEWIPPAQPWVDPLKDANATLALLKGGLMSRRQAVAQLGYSIDELDSEIAADKERETALGLSFNNNNEATSNGNTDSKPEQGEKTGENPAD